ncbi:hypothetical protein GPECTOR_14g187 [Gonium pectorale]|uniref:Signal peptidase complex subunit 3 n=1 Tax=Gonium pectorale TaxID=33097 RepID=A0A150GNM5_GONPE|nr:hypothetical protein GPECTOR_14g187 [Gonium pectorale]|eukprot:KXZ50940.1 hypothetical protein GPECTOR_14g187 [Gonium pectorale]
MSDLRLVGGPIELYDDDVVSLLYGRPSYDSAGPCGDGGGGGGGRGAAAPRGARLHTLALVGLPLLTARLPYRLLHGCTGVRHVRMEECGGGRRQGRGDGATAGPAAAAIHDAEALVAESLLRWLCCCRGLVNLRVRHCCQWGPDVVSRLAAACPSLEALMLDDCDLPPRGFEASPAAHGALGCVLLARCREDAVRGGGGACGGLSGAVVTFDLNADLRSVFSWNTKQLFVYVQAEYETDENRVNEVVLWDHIVQQKDKAHLRLSGHKTKYAFIDAGRNLRGRTVNLTLVWCVMPRVGRMYTQRLAGPSVKLPGERRGAGAGGGREWIARAIG